MATVQVYVEEQNRNFQITITLAKGALIDGTGEDIYYLTLNTTFTQLDGTAFPTYLIQDLTDVAPGYSTASTFTELINGYIQYFLVQGQIGQSSSSSSTSSSSSSQSSSSSSSFGDSSSSSSSESSSSSSSSSSEMKSSSSSSNSSSSSSSEMKSSSSSSNSSSSSSSEMKSSSSSSSGI